jgi:2-desacetyl-2-hydroxyethyl bacteriochlorophyllide A dehydrogenase
MLAFQIVEPRQSRIVELPRAAPAAGEVLLAVRRVGFCGTDLSTFRGGNPLVSYPRVPGHEVSGVVAELGDGVTGWSVGDSAAVFPYQECGGCSSCLAGRPNCCRHNQTLGVQREGAMAEYLAVPVGKLLRADGLSHGEQALIEPLTIGFHAVARGGVRRGDKVVVLGAGAIGLGAIAGAARCGAMVIAVDVDDAKLRLAEKCGAAASINSREQPLHERLQELTGGHGPDVVIEAVGRPETFVAAVDEVCYAGRVVYIGYSKTAVEYDTKQFVLKELDIRGSRNALPADFAAVIEFLQAGRFPTGEVITQTVPLEQAGTILKAWDAAPERFTKIQLEFAP